MTRELSARIRSHPAAASLAAALFLFTAAVFLSEGVYRAILFSEAYSGRGPVTFELYGVGDSTMRGLPFYKSPPEVVAALFADRLAGLDLSVNNLAEGGNSTYTQAVKAIRTLKYRDQRNPAVVLIYSSHAENINMQTSRRTLLPRMVESFKRHILIHSLLFSKIVFSLERYALLYGIRDLDHHEFYLRRIIEAARESGAVPVLTTLASNMEMEPSVNDYNPPGADGAIRAFGSESRGEYAKALAEYTRLYKNSNSAEEPVVHPYLAYRIGRCLQLMGKPEAAAARLVEALEADPFPFRAKPSQNAMIRRLAAEYAIPLVDAVELFAKLSDDGMPGAERFLNPMHPDTEGYLLLARAYAGRLETLLGDKVRNDIRGPATIYRASDGDSAFEARPYITAGACLIWSGLGGLPVPDHLNLAEKDFKRAIKLDAANNLPAIGLRIVLIAKKNRYMIPREIYDWFQEKRGSYIAQQPLPDGEMKEAEKFLAKWEQS